MDGGKTSPARRRALASLERRGLLLLQDKLLPSMVTEIVGEALASSWWGHPRGHEIFRTLVELEGHPDVLLTRLVSRKRTFVHRALFAPLVAVGQARAPWQVRGVGRALPPVDEAKATLAAAVGALAMGTGARPKLPWP